ncbi:MAG: potassium channel family protein [Geminicoccaceae bacterium]
MFSIVIICAIVGLATVLIHQRGLLGIADLAARYAHVRPAVVIPGVVVGIFGLHLIEIGLFAGAIAFASYVLHLGRIVGDVDGTDLELLYFSAETFTTLGFGDIIPSGQMRLLASFEPLNGLILLGWSASFIHLEVERYWRRPEGAPARMPSGLVARPNIAPAGLQRGRHALRRRYAGAAAGLGSSSRRRVAAGRQ